MKTYIRFCGNGIIELCVTDKAITLKYILINCRDISTVEFIPYNGFHESEKNYTMRPIFIPKEDTRNHLMIKTIHNDVFWCNENISLYTKDTLVEYMMFAKGEK